jgi:hypothetical protein
MVDGLRASLGAPHLRWQPALYVLGCSDTTGSVYYAHPDMQPYFDNTNDFAFSASSTAYTLSSPCKSPRLCSMCANS